VNSGNSLKEIIMNEYLRSKIKVLSFFLVVLVVFVHSYNIDLNLNTVNTDTGLNALQNHRILSFDSFLQEFLCNGMFRICSPLFFIISGYLFFVNLTGKPDDFKKKLKKRFNTLIIPYLFWSLWGIAVYFLLQSFPQSRAFFTKVLLRDYSIQKLLHTLFLDPIPYQLWYVRDLAVFAVLSPVLYFVYKYIRFWMIPFCLFMWFYDFNFVIFRSQSFLFFTLGALISKRNEKLLDPASSGLMYVYGFLWIAIVLIKTRLLFLGLPNPLIISILHKIGILMGILTINHLYDLLFKNTDVAKTRAYKIVTFSFFVFTSHEPVITIIKKGLFFIAGNGEIKSVFIFFLAPLLTIPLCISVGYLLKKHTPNFYGIITGWR
jgi:fucose 4-O-acetylase-like acetyltransferase